MRYSMKDVQIFWQKQLVGLNTPKFTEYTSTFALTIGQPGLGQQIAIDGTGPFLLTSIIPQLVLTSDLTTLSSGQVLVNIVDQGPSYNLTRQPTPIGAYGGFNLQTAGPHYLDWPYLFAMNSTIQLTAQNPTPINEALTLTLTFRGITFYP